MTYISTISSATRPLLHPRLITRHLLSRHGISSSLRIHEHPPHFIPGRRQEQRQYHIIAHKTVLLKPRDAPDAKLNYRKHSFDMCIVPEPRLIARENRYEYPEVPFFPIVTSLSFTDLAELSSTLTGLNEARTQEQKDEGLRWTVQGVYTDDINLEYETDDTNKNGDPIMNKFMALFALITD